MPTRPDTARGRDELLAELQVLRAKVAEHALEASRWRPEVRWFADAMEAKLRMNDHKGHWRNELATEMLDRAREELGELRALSIHMMAAQVRVAERPEDAGHRGMRAREILAEAADVANMVMMVADLCARGMVLLRLAA